MLNVFLPMFFSVVLYEVMMLLEIGGDARAVVTQSMESMHILASVDLADSTKEAVARHASAKIFKPTARLAIKLVSSIFIFYILYRVFSGVFPRIGRAVVDSFVSPLSIAIFTAALACYAWARKAILARS